MFVQWEEMETCYPSLFKSIPLPQASRALWKHPILTFVSEGVLSNRKTGMLKIFSCSTVRSVTGRKLAPMAELCLNLWHVQDTPKNEGKRPTRPSKV